MTLANILCKKDGREKYFSQEQLDLLGTQDGKHDGWEKFTDGVVKSTGIVKTSAKEIEKQNDGNSEENNGVETIAENLDITNIENAGVGEQQSQDTQLLTQEVSGKKLPKEPKEKKVKNLDSESENK